MLSKCTQFNFSFKVMSLISFLANNFKSKQQFNDVISFHSRVHGDVIV